MHPCIRTIAAALALALTPVPTLAQASSAEPTRASHAMVVTIHHDATDAGLEILQHGGNAIDAAVAVGFALAVVYPEAGNLGGGGFMLLRTKSGDAHFLDFRERAPAAATADHVSRRPDGNPIPGASTIGYKASGVPGTVAGLVYAQRHFGKLSLAADMAPAIRLARDGFVLSAEEARMLHSASLTRFPISAQIFQRNGTFYAAGDTLRQPLLAATLTRIAQAPNDFYRGDLARQIAAFESANGGLITAADLAAYQVRDRAPLTGSYRGYSILTAPPPSSGGIVLLETLNILSGYDLSHIGDPTVLSLGSRRVIPADAAPKYDRSAAQVHLITEAFRRAFMDRTDYLGDPDFTQMPIQQMASPAYAAAWRRTIDPTAPTPSATLTRPAGFLPAPPAATAPAHESTQTTHFSVVDAEGNAVSTTYTLNDTFGSGVTVAGLGFLLNDEMDDFTSKPGVPNMYGLSKVPRTRSAPVSARSPP